jgi:hypothetical protein
MKSLLLASVASVFATAFMSDVCETVMVKGGDGGDPIRINKSDYDADQAEGGAKKYHLHADDKQPQPDPIVGTGPVPVHPALTIPPAPSAPNFVNPVAPQTASADTLMVAKGGTGAKAKFFVVRPDGTRVEDMRDVDKDGYATEALAWAAVEAVKKQPFEQAAPTPPNVPPAPVVTEPLVVPPLAPPVVPTT